MVSAATPLADVKRQATVDHILNAARRFVVMNGLSATMDQMAEAGGVSVRTLFRLCGTREQLIAAAFEAGIAHYGQELPAFEGDLDRWLRDTCDAAHRMNASYGPGFWELTSRTDLPPTLAAAQRLRQRKRRQVMTSVANVLWIAGGHVGDPPADLVAVVAAHLSSYFTAAVVADAEQGWKRASILAYTAITTAMDSSAR